MNINAALSARSDFSVGESLLQIDHLVEAAKAKGYESVALVDTMSIHGLVDFTNKAKKAGIRPIAGCRLRVYIDPKYRKPSKASGEKEKPNPFFMPKVYVKSEKGIKSLMALLSKGNSAEYFYYHSRVGLDELMALEDVIVTTGDLYNLFHFDQPASDFILNALKTSFGDDLYIDLTPINTPLFDTLNARALRAAELLNIETLLSYPMMYRETDDASTLEVLAAITTNTTMDSSWRPQQFVKDFCVDEPKKLIERAQDARARVKKWNGVPGGAMWANAIKNIEKVVAACEYEFKKMPVYLPTMAPNEFGELGRKCIEGWKRRFAAPVLGHKPDAAMLPVYQDRLKYELATLKKMGFSGYFLLTEDLVMWAKNNGVIVGPGRGSVGGSLVAYLLGITDVDPIRFNLIFERFINPDRIDLPDADLDFMSSKRHLVVEYLRDKYGKDRVAGISNYSTLASASALRDAGRMFGMSGLELSCTKLVPKEHGISLSLTEAADAVPELDKFRDENKKVWKHALKLEGAMRSFGQHAAGIVVAGGPLIDRAVVESRDSDAPVPVVNWDKRVVEDFGLVKMDLLGLSTLDVLEIARQYIEERHGKKIDYLRIPLDEPDIMEAFAKGQTTGVFQFESGGMKKLLKDLAKGGALTFDDISAATALYRPGPMDSGMMDDFVARKQGRTSVSFDHPLLEEATKDTYGVMVYQEQVMQVTRDMGGFSMAEADGVRKAMGKKDMDKLRSYKEKFVKGATDQGVSAYLADEIFTKMEAFGAYGFNKSHSVEYSIISYWTLWVKIRYPAEYYAACMSIVAEDKLPGLVADARADDVEVLPPDVQRSADKFTIPDDKHILAPFNAIKGVSENTARAIVALRDKAGGRFTDKSQFVDLAAEKGSKVNKTVVERLGLVGAFSYMDKTEKPARDMSRRKDQMELMPGLIIDAVKADRTTDVTDKFLRAKVIEIVQQYRKCEDCDLAGQPHPAIRMKSTVKFMVVSDCPNWQEEKKDKLLEGEIGDFVKTAIVNNGLSLGDGYYTTLVKAKKNDKFLSNAQLNGCRKFIEREVEVIKPAVIVALGSASIKHFLPGHKGGTADLVGKAIYDPKLDATIVCGLNPSQLIFDLSKAPQLEEVFAKVKEILE